MKLFEVLAGRSSDHFTIGDVEFQAAPLTLTEYAEYLSLPRTKGAEMENLRAQAEFLASKLQHRVRGVKVKAETITGSWLMDNLELPMLETLQHVMLYGKLPEEGQPGKP